MLVKPAWLWEAQAAAGPWGAGLAEPRHLDARGHFCHSLPFLPVLLEPDIPVNGL